MHISIFKNSCDNNSVLEIWYSFTYFGGLYGASTTEKKAWFVWLPRIISATVFIV